ncbi:hypothetical protein M9458_019579, partial [Cirrhinus mrigala]
QIEAATRTEPAPPGGPEGKIFVPTSLRHALLDSACLSRIRASRQLPNPLAPQEPLLVAQHGMGCRSVKGCSVCAITSTPRRLPKGKLVPLPIPRQPWSHLGID